MRDPIVAGVLSFLIPGAGQLYNGCTGAGAFWMLVAFVLWVFSAGLLGWIVHIIAAYTAYSYAKEHPVRT